MVNSFTAGTSSGSTGTSVTNPQQQPSSSSPYQQQPYQQQPYQQQPSNNYPIPRFCLRIRAIRRPIEEDSMYDVFHVLPNKKVVKYIEDDSVFVYQIMIDRN